jgi:hypothetical protein
MKKSLLLIGIVLLIQSVYVAQQPMPRALMRDWIFETEKIETLNQNVIANKRLTNESVRFDSRYAEKPSKWNSETIKTGKKDPNGNEIIHIKFYKDGADKNTDYIILKPDFEDYPLKYTEFILIKDKIIKSHNNQVGGKSVLGYDYVINDDELSDITSMNDYQFIQRSTKYNEGGRKTRFIYEENAGAYGVLSEEESKKHSEIVKNRKHKEAINLYDAVEKWSLKHIEKAKTLDYKKEMNAFKDGDAFMIRSEVFDSLKVKFIKSSSGELTEIILHYPFMGGIYADNDKFKIKLTKDAKGYFTTQGGTDYINLRKSVVIPFEGRLLFCNSLNEPYGTDVYSVLSFDIADNLAYNITIYKQVFSNLTRVGMMLFNDYNKNEVYTNWYLRKNFETTYDRNKDLRYFPTFLSKYITALINKK